MKINIATQKTAQTITTQAKTVPGPARIKQAALYGLILPALFSFLLPLSHTATAYAQTTNAETPSAESLQYAALLGAHCPEHWESNACLGAVSKSNLALVSTYGAKLQNSRHNDAAETIKQHCAASTAAADGSYPAYAMKSAFTECANAIETAANKTGIDPDRSHYQLLIGATLCLDKDQRCNQITQSLRAYAAQ